MHGNRTPSPLSPLSAQQITFPTGRNQSCLLLDHPPRIVVDNEALEKNQLGTVPKNEKKPDDRQILLPTPPLHFTVYLFNREIIQPEIERVQVLLFGEKR